MIQRIQSIQPMFHQMPKHKRGESDKKQRVSVEPKTFSEVLKEVKEKKYGAS